MRMSPLQNAAMAPYLLLLLMAMAMLDRCLGQVTTTTQSPISGCPPSESISPCLCSLVTSGSLNGLSIDCNSQNLTDSQLSTVLNVFLSPQYISPVFQIMAVQNQLTYVPNEIPKFKSLEELNFSFNQITNITSLSTSFLSVTSINIGLNSNQITSIPSQTFKFSNATLIKIYLRSNQISSIPSGMFDYPLAYTINIDLDSNRITSIPSNIFNCPNAISVYLYLAYNQITSIPPGVFNYSLAGDFSFDLSYNNITSLPTNAFITKPSSSFSMNSWSYLNLKNNKITTIAPGSFKGFYSEINVDGNQLTNFRSGVFKSVLIDMMSYIMNIFGSYVRIEGNSIDCSACDLAWLIRDNRQLLGRVQNGTCSNGTAFEDLSPFGFQGCTITCSRKKK